MRSFLAAAFALCVTWGITGCEPAADTKKDTPPVVEPKKDAMEPKKDAMEPKAETPTPAPAPTEPKKEEPK